MIYDQWKCCKQTILKYKLFTLIAIPPSIEHATGTSLQITSKRRKEGEPWGHSVQFHTNDV